MAARIGVKRIRAIARTEARRELKEEQESKVLDVVSGLANISALQTTSALSLLAQGSDYFNRTGAQVQGHSLFLRLTVRWNPAAANPAQLFRIVVFMDTQSEGVIPSGSGTANSLLVSASTEAQLNPLTRKRFLVLWNKVGWVNAYHPSRVMKKNIKLRSPTIQFMGPTAVAASLGTNSLYIIYWGDVIANMPTLSYESRFRFTDA